jgi:hypothetical protein
MYGVPEDLDLTPFIGTTLDSLGISAGQIQFVFGGNQWWKNCVVTVEGYWEMRDDQSAVVDKATESGDREAYKIHRLLTHAVKDTKVNPPESFTLTFDNGWTLTFADDSSGYESCHIYIGDGAIHI